MRPLVERDALVVAMALVPGLYSRNRMFAFFKDPAVQRARARAVQLRGVVRQLAGAHGGVEIVELRRPRLGAPHGDDLGLGVLHYRIAALRLQRRIELSPLEAACVAYLCGRAGVTLMHPLPEDRAALDAALRRLAGGLHLAAVEAGTVPDGPAAPPDA